MAGYVIKVTIEDTHPPVWRRIVIPRQISFGCLHEILQIAFGWENEHLHGFTLPQSDIQISGPELETWGTLLPEDKTAVDTFLQDYKWIRYTYDFGDDWRHKIVFEKEAPDYQERHAVILKAKGDNFEEDSGGAWGQETQLPFDMESANERLARKECPVVKESRKTKSAISQEKKMREIEVRMKEIQKLLRRQKDLPQAAPVSKQRKKTETSQMQKKQEAWDAFFWEAETGKKGVRYVAEVKKSQRSSREYLQQLSAEVVKDYCRYLRIPRETFARLRPVDALWECLKAHPAYYLYVLSEDVIDYGRKLLARGEGEISLPEFPGQVSRLAELGLVYLEFQQEKNQKKAIFSVASDMEELFACFTDGFCQETYQMLEQYGEAICCYAVVYGLIPLDLLYERYKDTFEIQMEKEDFLRIVYWYCRCNELIRTYTETEGNVCYAAVPGLDPHKILEQQKRYGENLEYRPFTKNELLVFRDSFGEIYPCWQELGLLLLRASQLEKEEVEEVVPECFREALYGKNREELADFLEEFYTPDNLGEQITLWHILTDICMDTRLPVLKGYTRREYGKKEKTDPFQINAVDVSVIKDTVEEDTSLFELPLEIQRELLEAIGLKDVSLRIKAMERLLRKVDVENKSLLYEMAVCYLEGNKQSRASKILERLDKLCPEDDSVWGLEDRFTEEVSQTADELREYGAEPLSEYDGDALFWDQTAASVPYQRAERKIGRNEPCPCGSGKKYKHCCGKNA